MKIVIIIIILLIWLLWGNFYKVSYAQISKPVEDTGFINTENQANKELQFYYYVPVSVQEEKQISHPVLVCVPGLSGNGKNFVSQSIKEFADTQGIIIIAPSFKFDKNNWDTGKSYQYSSVWSGNALLKIIKKINKLGYKTSHFYLYGFSAGAQFVLRFALWKPDISKACIAHAGGGRIIPLKKVNTKFLVTCCDKDKHRLEHASHFYHSAKTLGIDVTYKKYKGGHILPKEQEFDAIDFLTQVHNEL